MCVWRYPEEDLSECAIFRLGSGTIVLGLHSPLCSSQETLHRFPKAAQPDP